MLEAPDGLKRSVSENRALYGVSQYGQSVAPTLFAGGVESGTGNGHPCAAASGGVNNQVWFSPQFWPEVCKPF